VISELLEGGGKEAKKKGGKRESVVSPRGRGPVKEENTQEKEAPQKKTRHDRSLREEAATHTKKLCTAIKTKKPDPRMQWSRGPVEEDSRTALKNQPKGNRGEKSGNGQEGDLILKLKLQAPEAIKKIVTAALKGEEIPRTARPPEPSGRDGAGAASRQRGSDRKKGSVQIADTIPTRGKKFT